MGMLTTLRTPGNIPEWCTDESVVLEPPAANVATGWVLATRPAAPIMNWLQNMYGKWIRYFQKALLSNWTHIDIATQIEGAKSIIYHPEVGIWMVPTYASATAGIRASRDGVNFTAAIFSSNVVFEGVAGNIAIDTGHFLICHDLGITFYNADLSTYGTITKTTIGSTASKMMAVGTKYPETDYVIAVDSAGKVFHSTGIHNSWTAAATQPPSIPSGTPVSARLTYLGTSGGYSKWHLLWSSSNGTNFYISTNDGATWFSYSGDELPFPDSYAKDFAINYEDEVRVCVGRTPAGGAKIQYSVDPYPAIHGTWTTATIDADGAGLALLVDINTVYYCGNGFWVAGGYRSSESDPDSTGCLILVSDDNAVTWRRAHAIIKEENVIDDGQHRATIQGFACNGNFVTAISTDGAIVCQSNGVYIEGV